MSRWTITNENARLKRQFYWQVKLKKLGPNATERDLRRASDAGVAARNDE